MNLEEDSPGVWNHLGSREDHLEGPIYLGPDPSPGLNPSALTAYLSGGVLLPGNV